MLSTAMIQRQAKTAEGLRDRLFGILDGLVDGSVAEDKASAVCLVAEQILASAKVDCEIARVKAEGDRLLRHDMKGITVIEAEYA